MCSFYNIDIVIINEYSLIIIQRLQVVCDNMHNEEYSTPIEFIMCSCYNIDIVITNEYPLIIVQ